MLQTEARLRIITDTLLKNTRLQFLDKKKGNYYTSAEEAPQDVILNLASPYTDWRYWNGVLNIAMLNLGKILKEQKYIELTIKKTSFSFDNYSYFKAKYKNEEKWSYPFAQLFIMEELDDFGAMGASLIQMYQYDKQKRYLQYINKAGEYIRTKQNRLEDNTFARNFPHKWTIWADDLYMSISFLARMGDFRNDIQYFDDAVTQVLNFHKYLFNNNKGIMSHCWYSDTLHPGVAFWGRANGWTILAQVELLDYLPEKHPQRKTLLSLLEKHILGIIQYQGKSGLWHQLIDKIDSYEETSCSAMFTYAIARAVNKGYIKPRYASIAHAGWEGICSKIRSDGQIEGVCTGTVVREDLTYYYNRPTPINDIHGTGIILLTGSEILNM